MSKKKSKQKTRTLILEVASGLENIAKNELQTSFHKDVQDLHIRKGEIEIRYKGELAHLSRLKTVQAVYLVADFDIPRPKAFMGHQHFTRLVELCTKAMVSNEDYMTLTIQAAGKDSSVMVRLRDELAKALNLVSVDDEADLILRIRKSPTQKHLWQVLVRIGNRPLGTREWRKRNFAGALNGAVAQAMLHILKPKKNETMLNVMCGSGTFVQERSGYSIGHTIGIDIDPERIQDSLINTEQTYSMSDNHYVSFILGDARDMPFTTGTFRYTCADFPFGQKVGSHGDNLSLYPAVLKETARVMQHGGRFIVITHEVKLIEKCLYDSSDWHIVETQKIILRGLHPRIYLLERR